MRASGRRRGLRISAPSPTAIAAVLAVVLPLSPRAPAGFHYLPIHKAAGGGWSVGQPCTPS